MLCWTGEEVALRHYQRRTRRNRVDWEPYHGNHCSNLHPSILHNLIRVMVHEVSSIRDERYLLTAIISSSTVTPAPASATNAITSKAAIAPSSAREAHPVVARADVFVPVGLCLPSLGANAVHVHQELSELLCTVAHCGKPSALLYLHRRR